MRVFAKRGRLAVRFICLLAIASGARAARGPHGTVELLSDEDSIQPGRDFSVGFHFQLDKGWHIYWINPGDSGEPPKVQWDLPAGFRAGALEWPAPRRIPDHSLINYGYEGEVLLPVQIHAPATLGAGSSIPLKADVTWLVCREICIPGRAHLSLAPPVGDGRLDESSRWHTLFEKTRARLPRTVPKHWKLAASLQGRQVLLEVDTGKRETAAAFFPLEPNQVENAAPQEVSSNARGLRLALAKSDQMVKPAPSLAGVLVLGSGQAYVIKVPVVSSSSR